MLRRATFDLIGLPPTPKEVEDFLADDSPDAFAKVVDRLLASPHYGERWGRHWLDLAHYADTKGTWQPRTTRYPYAYTYRDYVIRAFNEDLPYDQFLIQQIAADKLPLGDDKRPLAAMGFLTLGNRFNNQINDIIDDRIDIVCQGHDGADRRPARAATTTSLIRFRRRIITRCTASSAVRSSRRRSRCSRRRTNTPAYLAISARIRRANRRR